MKGLQAASLFSHSLTSATFSASLRFRMVSQRHKESFDGVRSQNPYVGKTFGDIAFMTYTSSFEHDGLGG